MKVTPFYANKGYHPNLTVHPECDLTSPRAQEFITDLNELHQHLRENMAAAQLRYQGTADAHRLLALEFPIGSWAFVKAQFFRTTHPSKKLADKFLGPYKVIAARSQVPIQSRYGCQTTSAPSTRCSTSQC